MDNASSIFEDARDGGESGRARSFGRQDNGGPFKSEGQGVFEDPVTYLLLRDAIPYAEWGSRSLGKRWIGIRPYAVSGEPLTWRLSMRRNATLAGAATVWAVLYLIGGYKGIPFGEFVLGAAGIVILFEAVLVAIDPAARRLGDRWAKTRVIEARH